MHQSLGEITLVVREYDEAIAWFTSVLGFELIEDTTLTATKRWVVVAPPGSRESTLLLARAVGDNQVRHIGDQTGGRVAFFLHTDDVARDYRVFQERGVRFLELLRHEPYGTVAVFEDLYGNRWDLIQRH